MSVIEFTCIVCPRGCHITVDENLNVKGNFCPKGKEYVLNEINNPLRTLTTTIRVTNRFMCVVSVKTSKPIPKKDMYQLMEFVNKLTVEAPTYVGQIVSSNPLGLDADIVITKEIE